MKTIVKAGIILILLSFLWLPLPAGATTVPLAEATLNPGEYASIHYGVDGWLYMVDEASVLWRINPNVYTYEKYYPTGLSLVDAVPDASGKIWWTDGADKMGYFGGNLVSTWTLPDIGGNSPNIGPLAILGEQIWLANWSSTGGVFGIYRLTPGTQNTPELCHFPIPGGSDATDLVVQGGKLWWLSWKNQTVDELMSLTPGASEGQWVSYPLGRNINQKAGMTVVGDDLWWAEDTVDGKIVRFNTVTKEMTLFSLPVGAHPIKVTALYGAIWYTDASGSFGRIDPGSATGTPVNPSASSTVTSSCTTLGLPTQLNGTPGTGALTWSSVDSTVTQPQAGLEVYSLPAGAAPLGIAADGNSIWLDDDGRNKMIRLDIENAPMLKLVKNVIKNNGGTAVAHDWTLTATGAGGFSDFGDSTTFHEVSAGVQYTLSESAVAGYQAGNWSCNGGTFAAPNKITLALDADVICTITNDDIGGGNEYHTYIPLVLK
jgi:streptogramin lyase